MSARPGLVLVVDDDAAVRNSLKFALELEGLEVRLYADAEALLRDAAIPETGCLVVDYYMRPMNGLDLVRSLRRRRIALPAILITAQATAELRERARADGICTVLEKPLEDSALLDTIRSALGAVQAVQAPLSPSLDDVRPLPC